MSHAVNSALLGLRNIIKDSDSMEWYAPNKMYKFEMQRYDCNSNIITTNSNSNYIIEIRINVSIKTIICIITITLSIFINVSIIKNLL